MKRLEKWKRIMAITLTALMVVQQGSVTTFAEDAAIQEAVQAETETVEPEPAEVEPAESEAPAEEPEETPEVVLTEAPSETTPEQEQTQEQPETDDSSATEEETEKPEKAKAETKETKTSEKTTFEGATDIGTASVTLSTPISEKAVFVAKQYGQETDYFNNAIEKVSQWAAENNLALDDAVVYDMHFEENGNELAVGQNATVNLSFASPILAGKGGDIYVLHVADGAVSNVNGGISQNGDGSVSAATINTSGFSPFVFVRAGGVEMTDAAKTIQLDKHLKDSSISINGNKITFSDDGKADVTLNYGDKIELNLKWALKNTDSDIQGLSENDTFVYQLPVKAKDANGYLYDGQTPVGEWKISNNQFSFHYYKSFLEDQNNISGSMKIYATVTKEDTGNNNGGNVSWDFPGIGAIDGEVNRDTSNDGLSIGKSIDNSNTSTLDNRKVTLKVTSTGSNKNVLVKDSMGEFLTVAGGIKKENFTVKKKDGTVVSDFTVQATDNNNFEIALGNLGDGEEVTITYNVDVNKNALGQNISEWDQIQGLKNTAQTFGNNDDSKKAEASDFVHVKKTWVDKTGNYDAAKKVINWTITVNAGASLDIAGATIKDTLGDKQAFVDGSFKVTPEVPGLTWGSISKGGFTFPEGSDKTYTITYQTKPTAEDVDYGQSQVNNNVTITPGGEFSGKPGISKDAGVTVGTGHNFINKECTTKPNPGSAQEIEWKTTVSIPAGKAVTKAVFKDYFDKTMTLVEGSVKLNGKQINVSEATDRSDKNGFVYDWGKIEAKDSVQTFEFTYKTKISQVPDETTKYENKSYFVSEEFGEKTASSSYTYEVAKVAPGAYKWQCGTGTQWFPYWTDPSTGTFTWAVEMNDRNLLKNLNSDAKLKLIDILPEDQEYVADSAYIIHNADAGWNSEKSQITSVEIGEGQVVFDMSKFLELYKNTGIKPVIYYRTRIKDIENYKPGHKSYTNTAQWELNGTKGQQGSAYQDINDIYKCIDKSALYDQNSAPLVHYMIKVNQGGLDLYPDQDTYSIEDTSGSAIEFKFGTLKVNGEAWNDFSFENGTLTIKNLKDETPYVITYDSVVTLIPGVTFDGNGKNIVKFSGKSGSKWEDSDERTGEVIESSGTSTGEGRSVSIYKYENGQANQPLKDVEFAIYDVAVDTSGTEVTVDGNEKLTLRKTGMTGADGYLRIGGLLLDHVYLLKETTPLNGYTIDPQYKDGRYFVFEGQSGHIFDTSKIQVFGKNVYSYNFMINNDRIPAAAEIKVSKKVNGANYTADEDFKFTITGENDAPMPENNTVTVKNGKEASFGKIAYTKEGTYRYVIKETKYSTPGMTYDKAEHYVAVKVVKDETSGELTATVTYDDGQSKLEVVNEYDGTTSVEGTKTWNVPEGTNLPEKITVDLLRNGEVIDSKEVTADNNWKYSFDNLPKYNKKGKTYTYTVDEANVPNGYNKTVSGYDITNTITGTTSVEGTKSWNVPAGTKLPEKITVDLLRNGEKIDGKEVTTNDNWTYSWTELPKYSEDGKTAYTYTIEEESVKGYISKVEGYNIINTITGTTSVEGTKSWNVPEGTKLPEKITVDLLRNGEVIDSKEVTADDNWAYSWTELPKYSNDGMSEYTYTVDEEPVAGYNKTVDGFNITNTKSDVVTVEGTKSWNVPEGTTLPESITVNLLQNGTQIDSKEVTAADKWSYSWTDLQAYSPDGKTAYTYTVSEDPVDGYITAVAGTNITNTITGTTEVKGTKSWNVPEGTKLPEKITVDLLRNGEKINSKEVTAADEWKYSFDNLPKYSEDGKTAYTYTIEEEPVKGYNSKVEGYDIINTITGTTSVEGVKSWNVPAGTKLPEKITVDLLRNGEKIDGKEVTTNDNWTYSWTELPKYSEDGKTAYTYTIEEESVKGYISKVEGYNIINTITGTTSVEGTKTWEVLDGIDQPDSIVVNLLRNGEKIDSKKVTAEDKWNYSWTDLPKYSEDGLTAYEYTVDDGKNIVKEWTSGETPETIADIVPGITYTLEETTAPEGYEKISNAVNFVVDEEGNVTVTGSAEITVNGEKVPEVSAEGSVISVKDTMIRSKKAAVEVTKTLTHNELALGAVDQTFYVALYGDEACTVRLSDVKAIEFKNASSATVKFTDLEIGRQYYVSECTEDGTPQETGTLADGTAYIATFTNGNSVTVTEDDGTETVYFDNEFMKLPDGFYFEGKLTVTKELLDAEGNAKNSDKTFYAGIFDDKDYKNLSSRIIGDNVLELDMNGGSESSVTARVKIQENEDCVLYVTETDADGNPVEGAKGFAYNVSYKGNTTVTLNESNLKATVRIINKEKPKDKDKDKDKDKEEGNKKTTTTTTTNTTTSRSVKTGDNTPIALYLIILITAAGAVVFVFVYRKKRRESNK